MYYLSRPLCRGSENDRTINLCLTFSDSNGVLFRLNRPLSDSVHVYFMINWKHGALTYFIWLLVCLHGAPIFFYYYSVREYWWWYMYPNSGAGKSKLDGPRTDILKMNQEACINRTSTMRRRSPIWTAWEYFGQISSRLLEDSSSIPAICPFWLLFVQQKYAGPYLDIKLMRIGTGTSNAFSFPAAWPLQSDDSRYHPCCFDTPMLKFCRNDKTDLFQCTISGCNFHVELCSSRLSHPWGFTPLPTMDHFPRDSNSRSTKVLQLVY